ncbi:Peroxidase [Mycena venus]|uniref:Peroxidase n=1 Tax=Mycena venus TaxID=2733690 RepID=A0A8H6Y941_9AGAR|nr:Peroxidase [Mycena venus]
MRFPTFTTFAVLYITTSFAARAPRATCSDGHTTSNLACCIWFDVLSDIQDLFENACGDDAHDALRLAFHDAIAFSPKLVAQQQFGGGGADGSIIKFSSIELNYSANVGLDSIVNAEKEIADNRGVSYGDMIQFAAAVSVGNCDGGPRLSFMAGRPNATQAAPDGLVPQPFDSVSTILARVGDAGLSPDEMVELLASHSVGVQEDIDESIPGTPFDLTPTVFDTKFYNDTQLGPQLIFPGDGPHQGEVKSPSLGQFRLQSDVALSRDNRTAPHWLALSLSQQLMASRFAASMAKMALLGQNPGVLYDCSDVIPVPK